MKNILRHILICILAAALALGTALPYYATELTEAAESTLPAASEAETEQAEESGTGIAAGAGSGVAVTEAASDTDDKLARCTTGLKSRTLTDISSLMDWPAGPELTAGGAYLIELNSGTVLYEKNGDTQFYPASITKILTALVVIENASLEEMVTFSHNAVYDIEDGGFSYIAEEGDQLSVKDLLYALMLYSSNEAAYALAEHVGGSLEGFAVMMNEKARELGATNSNFVVPHGLTNSEHVTTPHDMACIMWGAIQNETFLQIDSTITYRTAPTTNDPEGFYCQMRHQMMRNTEYYDERVVAGKTGYISAAGNTLVTYAVSGDKEYICVIMKEQGSGLACSETKKLLNYGDKYFEFTDVSTGLTLADIEDKVEAETGRVVAHVDYSNTFSMLLPTGAELPELTLSVDIDDTVAEDINSMAGKVTYYYGDKEVGHDDLVISLVKVVRTTEATEPETTAEPSTESEVTEPAGDETEEISEGPDLKLIILTGAVILLAAAAGAIILISRRDRHRRDAYDDAYDEAYDEAYNEADQGGPCEAEDEAEAEAGAASEPGSDSEAGEDGPDNDNN